MKKFKDYSYNFRKLMKEDNIYLVNLYSPGNTLVQNFNNPNYIDTDKCKAITEKRIMYYNKPIDSSDTESIELSKKIIVKTYNCEYFKELLTDTLIPIGYISTFGHVDRNKEYIIYHITDDNMELLPYYVPIFEYGSYVFNDRKLRDCKYYTNEYVAYKGYEMNNLDDINIYNYSPFKLKLLIKVYKELHKDVDNFQKQLNDAFKRCQDELICEKEKALAQYNKDTVEYNRKLVKSLIYNDAPMIEQKK